MNIKSILTISLVGIFVVASCSPKKSMVQNIQPKKALPKTMINSAEEPVSIEENQSQSFTAKQRIQQYIHTYAQVAVKEMDLYKIPASITLAQGILESGAGNGILALKANNHFGVKCHSNWTGERVYHDDDELGECFRKYTNVKYSYRDHSLFLSQRLRYANLFKLKISDYKAWARGLKKSGYATDPKYPEKLISLIDRFELWKYDRNTITDRNNTKNKSKSKDSLKVENRLYIVVAGDTLYSISRRFGMTVERLMNYNGLETTEISIDQELLIPF